MAGREMTFREDLTLGVDLGIGSCGWALIRNPEDGGGIIAWGIRTFDVPETDKERTPTNQLRRQHRGLRRVIRRRRQRMNDIRAMLKKAGLLYTDAKSALKIPGLDPWKLRADGLDRKQTGEEFAVALGHIAKHRGFKSNSKRKSNEPASEDSKMLKAIQETQARLGAYRSVGELFAKDPEYALRKRNRDGDYSRSVLRDDLLREVRLLFDRQRSAGNRLATSELEQQFIATAFFQRPLADSEDKVGHCLFEPKERRAAKRSPSFERFRFLSRLTSLRVQSADGERPLTPEEIARAGNDFGSQKGMTFKRLRKILDLDSGIRFEGVPPDEEGKRDVVNRSSSNGCMQGTNALREALGEAGWNTFNDAPDKLDRIAFVLTFREDKDSIRQGLQDIGLEPMILQALMAGVERGDFSDFNGAGHISARACRNIIPHLMRGLVYSDACGKAGYDHAKRAETKLDQINNPVARKALTEAVKQVRAVVNEYGLPSRIHVELARDVGKSREERDEITRGIEKRNKAKDRLVEEFKETVGAEPRGEDLLRYELWKEQKGRCLYCDREIHPNQVASSDNAVQVDHILPWSRSGDDSFVNKTLCHAGCNQEKKGRTPHEWFGKDEVRWTTFAAAVESTKEMKGRKKRNYLLKDARVLEEKFRPRNLNDTRYACRLLLVELAQLYPDDGKVYVFSRPGPLTDRLRRGWGLQDLKKRIEPDGEKRKADDRHHALDALIVAATSQSALQKLTRAFQEEEGRGGHRDFSNLPPPWPGFIEEVRTKFAELFVSRAERRRARGEAHAATVRAVGEWNGAKVVFERKKVEALTERDLDRIKDPERNAALIAGIHAWLAAGKPKGTWPKSPKGDDVKKVTLRTDKKVDVPIRGGAAERGEMVRVDVFRKKNKRGKWEYYLVPIYPHQVADAEGWPKPPNRAIQGGKDENEWPEITADHEFMWSISPYTFLEVEKADGFFIDGYFRGVDRSTGAISLSPHHTKDQLVRGIGARTLISLRKIFVDRLGRKSEVKRELRTWRGEVCT